MLTFGLLAPFWRQARVTSIILFHFSTSKASAPPVVMHERSAACSHSVSASLARVHLPAFNDLMELDNISNSLMIPFRFAHMKKTKIEYLAIFP